MARAVDCLRILTSGNESNKLALTSSSSSLPSLVRLMDVRLTTDMVLLERAAAVLGNLSTSGECLEFQTREVDQRHGTAGESGCHLSRSGRRNLLGPDDEMHCVSASS